MKKCITSSITGAVSGFSSAIFGGVLNKTQGDDSYQCVAYGTPILAGYLLNCIISFLDDCTGEGCLYGEPRGILRCHDAVPYFSFYTLSFIGGATAGVIVSNKFIADGVKTENDTSPLL